MLGLASLMYDGLRQLMSTGGGETTSRSGNDFFPFLKPTRILGIPLHRVGRELQYHHLFCCSKQFLNLITCDLSPASFALVEHGRRAGFSTALVVHVYARTYRTRSKREGTRTARARERERLRRLLKRTVGVFTVMKGRIRNKSRFCNGKHWMARYHHLIERRSALGRFLVERRSSWASGEHGADREACEPAAVVRDAALFNILGHS